MESTTGLHSEQLRSKIAKAVSQLSAELPAKNAVVKVPSLENYSKG